MLTHWNNFVVNYTACGLEMSQGSVHAWGVHKTNVTQNVTCLECLRLIEEEDLFFLSVQNSKL